MNYQIQIEQFEGPFDLLLHLIEKNEVDIYDIPIAEITGQYLVYIQQMEKLDLDVASEFLVMAATLISIKAKMLLPTPPPEEVEEEYIDPRLQLVQDLLEYKKIKEAAQMLDVFYKERQLCFERPNEEGIYAQYFSDVNPLDGKTLADLSEAFREVWIKVKDKEVIRAISREEVSLAEMMSDIIEKVKENPKGLDFTALFEKDYTKNRVIVRFLSLLELVKISAVKVQQNDAYGRIYVFLWNLENYQADNY
ncbi:MAG: segregation/condensation protein A [Clostridia bacterium]|jgi:segregation and condensation protein A|nr:segregation/condensation protein A [Clostridia bacterium]MDD4571543.1 segregation/condensation protein A [Clostridia bacterium]